jgi:hypothetical protein
LPFLKSYKEKLPQDWAGGIAQVSFK